MAALVFLPRIGQVPTLPRVFYGAAGTLALGALLFFATASRSKRELEVELYVKTPHWLQACAQGALLLWWGWFVRDAYGNFPLLLGQLTFAYGLDALIQWTKGSRYQLGFGPMPIILSINFFLWFKPEFYHWQFVIVALGYFAKSFIHWERDGRKRHIFNPSSFPLSVFSLVLILTGTTDATYGLEIAQSLFNPPHIYLAIVLVTLPAQILFGVTTMTVAAVVTAFAWSTVYFQLTGTYYFRDAYIPIAVFLGMHLLFTDPATSPRTEMGRVVFGVGYATLTIAAAGILEAFDAPTFYDKLLPIPILNLMVRRIDRVADGLKARVGEIGPVFSAKQHRLAVVGLWVVLFSGGSALGGFGDDHPGQYLPTWVQACEETRTRRACDYVGIFLANYCDRGSGYACNELGIHRAEWTRDPMGARAGFERACALDFTPGCENLRRRTMREGTFATAPPPDHELRIVIRGSKGAILEQDVGVLRAMACDRGWTELCAAP